MNSSIKRLGLLAAFIALGTTSFAITSDQQIKISRALNSPTLAVKYSGAHTALVELRLNGESFGTRTMDDAPTAGETTFSLDLLTLKDGDNEIEILLYDKDGHLLGTEKTTISTDQNTKGPIYLTTPAMGANVMGPVEITVGFGKDFKNSYVSFFVDNQFKSMMNFPPFTYNWDTTRESNGWHELEAWVVDDTSSTFKTRKVRVFVNNPGGHTYRIATPVAKPIAKPVAKSIAKHLTAVIHPAKNVAPLPAPQMDLTATPNAVAASITGTSAPLKTIAQTTSAVAVVKTNAMPPAELGFVTQNPVVPHLEGRSAGLKPSAMPASISIGPRVMTPTGKRLVATKAQMATPAKIAPQIAKTPVPAKLVASTTEVEKAPIKIEVKTPTTALAAVGQVSANPVSVQVTASSQAAPKPAAQEAPIASPLLALIPSAVTKPTPAPAPVKSVVVSKPAPIIEKPTTLVDPGTLAVLIPATTPESAPATFKPLGLDMSGDGMVARPAAAPIQPRAPIVPAPATPITSAITSMATTDSVVKVPAVAPPAKAVPAKPTRHAKVLTVDYGTRFPAHTNYSIVYGGTPLTFDVAPTVIQGVPMTPFRHLIEHAGGDVKWEPVDKEVVATTDGKTIWLKIGDKIAKIDASNIQLELAPLIKSGRTIVPLSFIKEALNVDIDYDKATGHVLITPKK